VGLDRDEMLAAADAADATLQAATEEARAKGVFGSPSFVAGGELYWGNDRLEQALGL
jgi:2-hydroxychromene-2-carboxylate isomerase